LRIDIRPKRVSATVLCFCLAFLSLTGCIAVPKQAFDPVKHNNIHTIGITNIEYNQKVGIRRFNPLFIIIGSSGLVMQALAQEEKSSRYMARIGDFPQQCAQVIRRQLQHDLISRGYVVVQTDKDFWPTMKQVQKQALPALDALLRIKVKRIGFRAGGAYAPYRPSIMLSAKLIDIRSRKVLYEDTIAIGYKPSDMRMTILKLPSGKQTYPTLNSLLADAETSTQGIVRAMHIAVGQIATDLKQPADTLPFLAESNEAPHFQP